LKLALNPTRQRLQPVSNGIDWLGYIVRRDYLLVRRRVVHHLRTRIEAFEALLVRKGPGVRRYGFDPVILDCLAATVASYLGHFKMAHTYRLCCSFWKRYPFLSQYLLLNPKTRKVERTFRFPVGLSTIGGQYGYDRWRFSEDVLLFQVGKFFEFYHVQDQEVAGLLGLKPLRRDGRGARYGFPTYLRDWALGRLLGRNHSVTLILEREGPALTRIKTRVPVYRFEPNW